MGTAWGMRMSTHLLGDLGHTPTIKTLHSEIASEAVFGHKYHSSDLPVCSLHVRMKLAITHAKLIFERNFLHYFYPGTSEFKMGTGPGMPGCSYATSLSLHCDLALQASCILHARSYTSSVFSGT